MSTTTSSPWRRSLTLIATVVAAAAAVLLSLTGTAGAGRSADTPPTTCVNIDPSLDIGEVEKKPPLTICNTVPTTASTASTEPLPIDPCVPTTTAPATTTTTPPTTDAPPTTGKMPTIDDAPPTTVDAPESVALGAPVAKVQVPAECVSPNNAAATPSPPSPPSRIRFTG